MSRLIFRFPSIGKVVHKIKSVTLSAVSTHDGDSRGRLIQQGATTTTTTTTATTTIVTTTTTAIVDSDMKDTDDNNDTDDNDNDPVQASPPRVIKTDLLTISQQWGNSKDFVLNVGASAVKLTCHFTTRMRMAIGTKLALPSKAFPIAWLVEISSLVVSDASRRTVRQDADKDITITVTTFTSVEITATVIGFLVNQQ